MAKPAEAAAGARKGKASEDRGKVESGGTQTATADVSPQKRGAAGKAYRVSDELSAVTGLKSATRTEVVSALWAYIKEHGCQKPAKKSIIVADDKLRLVFGQDEVTMFAMNKLISPHLTAA